MKTSFDEMLTIGQLPDAEATGEQQRGPGVNINGAFHGNSLVSVLDGENVPVVSYVIGINGRGTLNIPEPEFDALLASMLRVYLDRNHTPVPEADFSEVASA